MRLTINLSEDHYAAVTFLARERDGSISGVVNELIGRALAPVQRSQGKQRGRKSSTGLPVIACDRVFTSEDVYRLESEGV